jgi:hypothetical protein
VPPVKPIKKIRQILFLDADAAIFHPQQNACMGVLAVGQGAHSHIAIQRPSSGFVGQVTLSCVPLIIYLIQREMPSILGQGREGTSNCNGGVMMRRALVIIADWARPVMSLSLHVPDDIAKSQWRQE